MFYLTILVKWSSATPTELSPLAIKRQDAGPEAPLYALVQRRLPPAYHNAFAFTLRPAMCPISGSSTNIYDAYKISNAPTTNGQPSKITIEAASLSGLGAGLNHYLKQICRVELTWSGDRFDDMPSTPPKLAKDQVLSGSSFVSLRYYMNVVTYGYSYAFWDWSRWEKELDWMMLSGVNMALAMGGQEYVLRQLYLELGLTDEEIDTFLSSPAYNPWQRMGNFKGSWGYKNSTEMHFKKRWYETQWVLQKRIIARMQDFNITAVLPSFNGFVPDAMAVKHPNATYEKGAVWIAMPELGIRVTYIPSTDPMFNTISKKYLELQTRMYNGYTSHYYLLDLYNELEPPCKDLPCLTKITSNVMQALKSADPQATWVLQSWFIVASQYWTDDRTKAFFDGIKQVNNGKDAFVFDLHSEVSPTWNKTQGYFGIDWGWSMLNNFGGGQGLFGFLPKLLKEPFEGYRHGSKAMRGMGITMEGIDNNEFLYQLVLDLAWQRADEEVTTPVDGTKLLNEFIQRRYGPNKTTPTMLSAWKKLSQTVWDSRVGQWSQYKTFLDATPALVMERDSFFMGNKVHYNKTTVVQAWGELVRGVKGQQSLPSEISSFRYDVIDVTREVLLAVVLPGLHHELVGAYNASDASRLRALGKTVLQLIDDTDRILNTHSHFMLGSWLVDARARAADRGLDGTSPTPSFRRAYEDYLEYHARLLVTWWGPQGQQTLADYGSKHWGGLVKTFYRPRWELFINHLQKALAPGGKPFDLDIYKKASLAQEAIWLTQSLGSKRKNAVDNEVAIESVGRGRIETKEKGDTVQVAQSIWGRWGEVAQKIAKGNRI
ncbi:hypothetical protein DFQ27_008573 [Actinomortierella ambigua]|uniref:Alpha-N-acetylglucosaminidase n=1 Tax=Actinomortierella ambigua TaxID=1343610 RepID=A0A9P6PTJ0_9FUNG|nr:hypothetical protein DFQ27_008573 [Actinomortierella ambigua]